MKNGILYFLKMDLISWAARIVLAIILISFPSLPGHGTAMPLAITIGCIALFFSCFHVRSNRHARLLINKAEDDFVNDFRHHHQISENCEIHVVRSYAADKKLYLSRRLDGMLIYPNLIFMTHYDLNDRCVVQVRVKSLLSEAPFEDFFYTVPHGESIDVKTERVDAKIEQVMVKMPDVNGKSIPEFPMRSDFHLRDFLSAVGCGQK